jgi:hypothetical protein
MTASIPHDIVSQLSALPYDHTSYFDLGGNYELLATDRLVASRARPEGIVNANKFMSMAASGHMGKRAPISVGTLEGALIAVIDGNSTFINALLSGWPDIPSALVL